MFTRMSASAKPFDSDAPKGALRPIIRYNPDNAREKEMIEAAWGTDPRFSDGISYRFVQAEGKSFPSRRCLILASEFQMKVGDKRYRVNREDGNFFYLAGIWEPAIGGWPLAFRIITVPANSEVARYQQRQGAIIQRRQVMDWLDATVPEADLLITPPAHSFIVEGIGLARKGLQNSLTP